MFGESRVPPLGTPLPGDFAGPELARAPERYVHELDRTVRAELSRLLAAIARGDEDPGIERAVHDVMSAATQRTLRALTTGTGLTLVRGIPVEGHSRATVARLYTMWGRAIGEPQAQNLEGELLTDVRDTGEDPNDPDVRRYRTRAEQDFHTDGADVIGLICLHGAKAGGESRVASSVRVFQVFREQHPDLAPLLFEPWFFRISRRSRARASGRLSAPHRDVRWHEARDVLHRLVHPGRRRLSVRPAAHRGATGRSRRL